MSDATSPAECPDVETGSDAYARRFRGALGAWFLEVQSGAIRSFLADLPSGSRILDVGGGHAQLTPTLVAAGYEVAVLGSAPEAIGQLERYVRDRLVQFDVGSFGRLPYETASFDGVVSVRLLPHLEGWRDFLREACRVARHAVVVDYPAARGFNRFADATFSWKKRIEGDTRAFTLFHPEQVAQVFRDFGYEVTETHAEYFWPMVLHRMHRSRSLAESLEMLARVLRLSSRWGSPILVRAGPRSPVNDTPRFRRDSRGG
jgi:SAM-dependent methyltransferase